MTAKPSSHLASASSFRFWTRRKAISVLICRMRGRDASSRIASNYFSAFTESRVRQAWTVEAIARMQSTNSSVAIPAFLRHASR